MAHHPFVTDLVRLVGRMFYRDEYSVVLDALARESALRDDGLEVYFGLPERQIRRILHDLKMERLVCDEDITERRARKRDRDYDWDAAEKALMEGKLGGGAAAAARAVNKKVPGAVSDSDSDEDAAGSGGGDPKKLAEREKRKITTKCWFINPRYFVDVVRYRLYLMQRHLTQLDTYQGGEAMFRCKNRLCTYECSAMEAQQRRTAELQSGTRSAAVGGVSTPLYLSSSASGGGAAAAAASAGPSAAVLASSAYVFRCPLCGSELSANHVDNAAAIARKLRERLDDQVRSSGLLDLLKQLDNLRLGANRPSDLIRAGKISLHGPAATKQTQPQQGTEQEASNGGAKRSSAAPGSGYPSAPPPPSAPARMFTTTAHRVEVSVEDEATAGRVSASAAAALAKAKAMAIAPAVDVAMHSLPAHLLQSGVTGEASRSLGFVGISRNQGGPGASSLGSRAAAAASGGGADSGLLLSGSDANDLLDDGVRLQIAGGDNGQRGTRAPAASTAASSSTARPIEFGSVMAFSYAQGPLHDSNVNADINADMAEEEADERAAAQEPAVTDAMLWQLLFADASGAEYDASAGAAPGSDAAAAAAVDAAGPSGRAGIGGSSTTPQQSASQVDSGMSGASLGSAATAAGSMDGAAAAAPGGQGDEEDEWEDA